MRDTFSSVRLFFSALAFALVHSALCASVFAQAGAPQESTSSAPPPERPLSEVMDITAGATCLDTDRLTLRIARWRERDTVDARIRVHVSGDTTQANRVSFVVSKQGGASAERTLADAPTDCDQFHSAVALAIALSIDATLTDPNAQREATLPVPPPTAAAPPAPAPLLPALEPEPKRTPAAASSQDESHLDLVLLLGPSLHMFQDTTLMIAPRVAYVPFEWLSIAAAGLVTHVGDQPVGLARGHFDATIVAGGLDLCIGAAPDPRFTVYGCAGARVGRFITSGVGFMKNFHGDEAWSALAGSVQVRTWLTDAIAVGASISFYGSLAQHVIFVDGTGTLADQSTELPRVGIGIELGPVFRIF